MPYLRHCLFVLCALAGIALMLPGNAPGNAQAAFSSSSSERTKLAKERASVKNKITSVQKDIEQKTERLNSAAGDLQKSEKAISQSNRTLKELSEKKASVENRLSDLNRQAKIVGLHVKDAEDLVGMISGAQFLNSRRSPLQNLLEGGNPNEVSRTSALLRYMATEQSRTLSRLENRQKNIAVVTERTNESRLELSRIEQDEQRNRNQLEKEKSLREKAVEKLKAELTTQKARFEQLVKNDRELTDLIGVIDKKIAAQAERERKRLAAQRLAQKKAEQDKKPTGQTSKKSPVVTKVEEPAIPSSDLSKLRGRLTAPTKGTIAAHFGQKRSNLSASLPWKGILIRAKAGGPVRAAASGSIVYSDWMRGYGNLLIVDHGNNYLTVYANNESLYKSVGESVKQGETIASVGNSGGEDSPGLYFELRYKGKPVDPEKWISGL